jgi:hypothetical protein
MLASGRVHGARTDRPGSLNVRSRARAHATIHDRKSSAMRCPSTHGGDGGDGVCRARARAAEIHDAARSASRAN